MFRMGPDRQHASPMESEDELVEPVTPTGGQEHDDSTWNFSSRLQAGRAGGSSSSMGSRHGTMHLKPTRHASLDAGHLQHRMYAAAQVLDRPAAGAGQDFSRAVQGSRTRSPGSATPNEGIEIAWVSVRSVE